MGIVVFCEGSSDAMGDVVSKLCGLGRNPMGTHDLTCALHYAMNTRYTTFIVVEPPRASTSTEDLTEFFLRYLQAWRGDSPNVQVMVLTTTDQGAYRLAGIYKKSRALALADVLEDAALLDL